MKKVSVIGIGKLGLCFALTLERAGYDVLGVDLFPDYVEQINNKTFKSDEENVENYLQQSKNFRATTDLRKAVEFSDILFIVVATPSLQNGRYDHSQIDFVINTMISYNLGMEENKDLVICSTTMPGYCDHLQQVLEEYKYNFTVSYNPEFIAQGTILKDQANPNLVLIGEGSTACGDILQQMYEKMTSNEPKIHRMSRIEAEIAKISLNCFLTTKISFANMIGDIVSFVGGDPHKVLSAIGSDSRIGSKYLGYGYGYGGPCFPRDNRALAIYANDIGVNALISKASDKSNEQHLEYQVQLFKLNNSVADAVEFDYISYKPQSTMLVESQQLLFAKSLADAGYRVIIKERDSVIEQVKEMYGDIFEYRSRE
jgi:nucleotide sugar dehydrogenase